MKRVSALILAVIMCAMIVCAFAFTAFAESTAYEISELNMSIPVPNDMLVLTRKSTKNDPFFKKFKLNYDDTMSQLKDGNIYLEAVTEDSSLTLTVTMTKTQDSTEIGSYNSLSDEELSNIMKKLRENKAYKDASPVEYNDIKYICLNMSYKNGKKTVKAQQYNTVMNGENINITMLAAPGKKLTAANKETLKDIVSETSILTDSFFTRNRNLILYGSITLVAVIIVVVAFIILLKYIRNPNRKHKLLVHELAHEHKISETTAIPRKHIFNVTQPTNSFLTKYQPVDEIGKRGKKKKATAADEVKNVKSVSEPVPEEAEEKPITSMEYDSKSEKPEDIVYVVDDNEIIDEVKAQAAMLQQEEAKAEPVAEKSAQEPVEAVEATEQEVAEATAEEIVEELEEEAAEASADMVEEAEIEAEAEVQEAEQSDDDFEAPADYFDNVPDEEEMYSYTDVDTAVEDYTEAKKQKYYDGDEEEEIESVQDNTIWVTVKKVLLAIGRGIVTVFKAIGVGIVYFVTHLRYFFINLFRMIKRNRAIKKRQRAEQERRRQESERRRMQREAERERRRANANRGENDLIKVRSSGERRRPPQSAQRQRPPQSGQRQRSARPSSGSSSRDRSSARRTDRDRSSRPRR